MILIINIEISNTNVGIRTAAISQAPFTLNRGILISSISAFKIFLQSSIIPAKASATYKTPAITLQIAPGTPKFSRNSLITKAKVCAIARIAIESIIPKTAFAVDNLVHKALETLHLI